MNHYNETLDLKVFSSFTHKQTTICTIEKFIRNIDHLN